ncbi:hypothetical protein [Sulfobacillus harzensis]|uniref:Uncharacterized protein n=1 Tax=Sulfobacillus harzensis TaxID=2729629 RepID=A0A7Y0L3D0_9FIRM|nr:hypothetical protein [Sulfobacillus harzensis]NMP22559.1 hypothetical protein [Sulfobacillus harzensis]
MPQTWAWFHNPRTVLSLVRKLGEGTRVSLLVRDPEAQESVMVMGPLSRNMACYPFLDVRYQIRRFGITKSLAEHYTRVIARGGVVVCIESADSDALGVLHDLDAQDVLAPA